MTTVQTIKDNRSANEKKKDEIKEKLSKSNVLFGRVCMPTLFYQEPIDMHREIDALLCDESIKFLDIIAPRGHAKSTLISNAFPTNKILTSAWKGQKEFILIISKTSRVAEELLGSVKYALNYSKEIIDLYGHYGEATAKEWTKDRIVLKNDTVVMARGIGQHITGIRHLEVRPTIVIVDDPQDRDNTKTEGAMEQHISWLLGEVLPAIDPFRGRIIVVGTPKHQLCIVEKLAKNKMWTKVSVPDPLGGEPKDRYAAIVNEDTHEVLWPNRHSWNDLMALQQGYRDDSKLHLFYSEYLCQIIGSEEQLFKPKYFMYYKGEVTHNAFGDSFLKITHRGDADLKGKLEELDKPDVRPVNLYMGVDPARGMLATSAFSAIVVVAVDKDRNIFILPYFRKHTTPMKLCIAIEDMYDTYKPSLVSIETVGYQEMIRDYLRNVRCLYMPGLHRKHEPRREKSARLERLEPYAYQRKLHLQPDMTELEGEMFLYPYSATYDLMDALDLATKRIFIPGHSSAVTPTEAEVIEKMRQSDSMEDWLLA